MWVRVYKWDSCFVLYIFVHICVRAHMCTHSQAYMNEEQLSCKYFIPVDILKMNHLSLFYAFDFGERQ